MDLGVQFGSAKGQDENLKSQTIKTNKCFDDSILTCIFTIQGNKRMQKLFLEPESNKPEHCILKNISYFLFNGVASVGSNHAEIAVVYWKNFPLNWYLRW